MTQARKIIVCVDRSKGAINAYEWAVTNVFKDGDEIDFVHVYGPPELPMVSLAHGVSFPSIYESLSKELDEDAKKVIEKFTSHATKYNIKHKGVRCAGDPREVVVQLAEDLNAAMVICGSRGMGGLKRFFLGSVSSYIVNHCNCPVIVVKPTDDKS